MVPIPENQGTTEQPEYTETRHDRARIPFRVFRVFRGLKNVPVQRPRIYCDLIAPSSVRHELFKVLCSLDVGWFVEKRKRRAMSREFLAIAPARRKTNRWLLADDELSPKLVLSTCHRTTSMTEVSPNSRRILEMERIFLRFAINVASLPFGLAQSKASVVSFGSAYGMGRFEVSGTVFRRISPYIRRVCLREQETKQGRSLNLPV